MVYDRTYFEDKFTKTDPWQYETSLYEQDKYQRQLDLAKKYCDYPNRVLEIGCAEGVFTAMLEEYLPKSDILAVDISKKALNRAAKRTRRTRYRQLDLVTEADKLDGQYDLVFMSEILYYIGARTNLPELADIIKTVRRVLRDKGCLIMANNFQLQDYQKTYMVARPLINAYMTLVGGYLKTIHDQSFTSSESGFNNDLYYRLIVFVK